MTQEYTIDIAELRQKSLLMLADIKEVLDKGNVNYWLDFGSLLGAVRDGRTIVWDGDFDLSTLDEDIAQRTDLWNTLRDKGYNVRITHSNIKIEKNSWHIGYYKTDLHRLRYNNVGEAEYIYGETYASKTSRFIKRVRDKFILILPSNDNKVWRTEFDSISRLAISAGIGGDELETLGPIKYLHGRLRSEADFSLEHQRFSAQNYPFNKGNKKVFIRLIKLLQVMPVWVLKLTESILNKLLRNSKTIHVMRVCHPTMFFEKLSTVTFHGMTFKAPQNVEEYLERIYGTNWRIPRTKWDIAINSPLRKNKGVKNENDNSCCR